QPVTLASLRTLLRMARRYPGRTINNVASGRALKGVRLFTRIFNNPSLSWDDMRKLRDWTDLPIILKGILHPDDAMRAVDVGVDGIIVSNHGGRQIDGSVSSFEMLPGITDRVGHQVEIIFDSGIRAGSDIFKCLALGAKAVCIGRPAAFGLALAGARGAEAVVRNLSAEFEVTMLLAGCQSIADIGRHCLKPA
ncbi:MAG: alpha-hydroxy-acid oxidizing protein, partial [Saprospiraceae bacterium]|nr:alpha-hydroxy-acid oxidizing protein [Saprospiraceae bacterium]